MAQGSRRSRRGQATVFATMLAETITLYADVLVGLADLRRHGLSSADVDLVLEDPGLQKLFAGWRLGRWALTDSGVDPDKALLDRVPADVLAIAAFASRVARTSTCRAPLHGPAARQPAGPGTIEVRDSPMDREPTIFTSIFAGSHIAK